jgi:hypothetical protein
MVNQVIELDEIRRKAYDQNCRNQSKVKKAFDKLARQRDFMIGDTVFLWDKSREKPGKHVKFDSLLTAYSTKGSTPCTMKICINKCKHVEDFLVLHDIFLLQHIVL